MSEILDRYHTLERLVEGSYKEKSSRFLALAFPISSEKDVRNVVAECRKKYYDARHVCSAFVLGVERSTSHASDDGEPSGTAGKPMLNQLLSSGLTNVAVVVVRWFGGTKLGVPGLINAYKSATLDALNNGTIIEKVVTEKFRVLFTYPQMNQVMKILKDEGLDAMNTSFELNCSIEFEVPLSDVERITAKFNFCTLEKI